MQSLLHFRCHPFYILHFVIFVVQIDFKGSTKYCSRSFKLITIFHESCEKNLLCTLYDKMWVWKWLESNLSEDVWRTLELRNTTLMAQSFVIDFFLFTRNLERNVTWFGKTFLGEKHKSDFIKMANEFR